VIIARRDNGEKQAIKINSKLSENIEKILEDIQKSLFRKAKRYLDDSISDANSWKSFVEGIKNKKILKVNFCGRIECEEAIKDEGEGATSRLIESDTKKGKCIKCGKPSKQITYFSKSY